MQGDSHIAVLGAGNMGTALAHLLAGNGYEIRLWDHFPEVVNDICVHRRNQRYLPGVELSGKIRASAAMEECLPGAMAMVLAVPSAFTVKVLQGALPLSRPDAAILNAAKGVSLETMEPVHALVEKMSHPRPTALLAGPAIANEFSRRLPTAVMLAARQAECRANLQRALQNDFFRVMLTEDVTGAALGGILKNVYAILLGYLDAAAGGGRNLEAAALNASLREMARLATAMQGKAETIYGLPGLGDLVATGFSEDSHNRRYGQELGRGVSSEELARRLTVLPEGVRSVQAALQWANAKGVEVPLAARVSEMVGGGKPGLLELMRQME